VAAPQTINWATQVGGRSGAQMR